MGHDYFRLTLCLTLSLLCHATAILQYPAAFEKRTNPAFRTSSQKLEVVIQPANFPAPLLQSIPATDSAINEETIGQDHGTANQEQIKYSDSITKPGVLRLDISDYLPAKFLTKRPYPLDSIDLSPSHLKVDGLVGTATIMLLISSEGAVDHAIVVDSSIPEIISSYAIDVFKAARFSPGYINDQAVRSQFIVQLGASPPSDSVGIPQSAKQLREGQLKSKNTEN